MNFNLKDILNPKKCGKCLFYEFEETGIWFKCELNAWSKNNYSMWDCNYYESFDYNKMIHKDCPLPRIKCANCKHGELWKSEGVSYIHCHKTGGIDSVYPCIEFEEVNDVNR